MSPVKKFELENKVGVRSPWREFEFFLTVVQQAIIPAISIEKVLADWNIIKANLMESPRKRQLQIKTICDEF